MPESSKPRECEPDDHSAFVNLFARDHQRIYGYVYSLLPNRADAEDVFQQTSLTLWKKFDQFDDQREFFPWACGIAFYTAKNFLRVVGRSRLRFSDDLLQAIADDRLKADDAVRAYGDYLDDCLERLSNADRALVRRVYGGEATVQEIAASLNRAAQTIYNRLNLIRRRLFECINRNAGSH